MITPPTREKIEAALGKAPDENEDENLKNLRAFERLLTEIETNGMMKMIDLDAYFGEISIPLEEEMERLLAAYPEDFAFFDTLMRDLTEEMQIHFETMDLYEDEEFAQFEEDVAVIKNRYGETLKSEYPKRMETLALRLLSDLED